MTEHLIQTSLIYKASFNSEYQCYLQIVYKHEYSMHIWNNSKSKYTATIPYGDFIYKESNKLKLQQTVIAVVVYNNLHTKNTALCY